MPHAHPHPQSPGPEDDSAAAGEATNAKNEKSATAPESLTTRLHGLLEYREKPDWSWQTLKSVVLVLLVTCVLSFIALVSVQLLQPSNMAVNRYLTRLNSPLAAALYKSRVSDQITVLLYDDAFLQDNDLSWPLKYGDQATWLLSAAGNGEPDARPKAMFVDITFGQERPSDKSIDELVDAVCRIGVDWQIPLYLAALPDPHSGELRVRSRLLGAERNGKPCFKLVGVDYEPDAIDGYAWSYPLYQHTYEHEGHTTFVSGRKEEDDQREYRSAAVALAEDAGTAADGSRLALQVGSDPLAVYWGVDSVTDADGMHRIEKGCTPGTSDLLDKLPPVIVALFNGRWPDPVAPLCSVHRSLSFGELNNLDDAASHALLRDKYVLVGAKVGGFNDWINSPVQGPLPGVHLHAMALDNLLTLGNAYKVQHEWHDIFHDIEHGELLGNAADMELIEAFVLTMLTVVGGAFLFASLKQRLKRWLARVNRERFPARQIAAACSIYRGDRVHSFVMRLVIVLVRWLLRLTVIVFLTLSLLLFFQARFRAGMLPVMELIGMVVLLEAFETLEWFGKLLKYEAKHEKGEKNESA